MLIKRNAYFGDGSKIRIGNNSQIGINLIMDNDVIIGDDGTRCNYLYIISRI